MNEGKIRHGLIPEWYPQEAVILAWPNELMDWAPILPRVQQCYSEIIEQILELCNVVLLLRKREDVPADSLTKWLGHPKHRLLPIEGIPLNDTWMRDVMPLFGMWHNRKEAYDFGFNGWGLKFAADQDNRAVRRLFQEYHLFAPDVRYVNLLGTILEGGAIDVNSIGEYLTTSSVMCHPNRNPEMSMPFTDLLRQDLPMSFLYQLECAEPMAGDDTDGHIDTLARFADDNTILYNATNDPQELHYPMLKAMEKELRSLPTLPPRRFRLVPLPIPSPIYGESGERLPATYANFLIINGSVLVPTYGDPMDEVALSTIQETMPGYKAVGIDCRALVEQHGSLHCITMQVPVGFINPEIYSL